MAEQNDSIQITGTTEKISFEQFGRESAANKMANTATLPSSLSIVYDKFLEEEKLDAEGIRIKINKLETEVLQKKITKENSFATKVSLSQEKEDKQNSIEELELDKIKLKEEGAPEGDIVPFVIGVFIVILLTLFLFVFYSSTVYSALEGIAQTSSTFGSIINPNVFADAQSKGGGDLAFIILAPVFFLAIGFLLHDFLDKKNYALIGTLLTLTFSVDAILGYKIAQNIHNIEVSDGRSNELWHPIMVFSDVNFYLVLIFGFVAYVIWGALLHYTLNKLKELQPDKILEQRLKNLDDKIEEKKSENTEIVNKINNLNSQISSIEHEIEQMQKDIIGYRNGVIPINIARLQSMVGQFMNGWFAFIDFMFKSDPPKAKQLTDQAVDVQKIWLENKIISLQSNV